MVVKTAKFEKRYANGIVANEARVMQQLDAVDNEGILYLRDFKTVVAADEDNILKPHTWRFYLENCPHGRVIRLL